MKPIAPEDWRPRGVPDLEPAAWDAVRNNVNSIVVAGPGAGKTELLAQRASFLLETGLCPPPFRILAISFKRDAARNLRERVALRCGSELARRFESYTFDAWAKSLLDRFRLALPCDYRPTADYQVDVRFAYDRPLRDRLLSICENVGVTSAKVMEFDVTRFFRQAISERQIDPVLVAKPGTGMALTQALWRSALHSGNCSALPFPMIGALAELILRSNPQVITALRSTYRFVFLDEFQDTTSSQFFLFNTGFHGSNAVVTAVGDNKQRIMLWAGAKSGVFDVFISNFAARRLGLVMNYRSALRLVEIQQHIIAELDPDSPSPKAADDGTGIEGECRLLKFADDGREARYLANIIAGWIHTDGVKPHDICVLARQQPDLYSQTIRAELAPHNIRCRVQNELQDLLSEPLTTATMDAFRVCAGGRVPTYWASLSELVLGLRGLDPTDEEARAAIHELSIHLDSMRIQLAADNTEGAIAALIRGLMAFFDESTFRQLHEQYLQTEFFDQTINSLAGHLARYRAENPDWTAALDAFAGVNCVPIMSIHKSKGLEYHTVILVGLEDYPFRGITSKNGEEECNFFVAFSRAKKRVVFTTADVRNIGRGARAQGRSDIVSFYELLAKAGVAIETIH
jgi:superfamily I DNA/RNA helicase